MKSPPRQGDEVKPAAPVPEQQPVEPVQAVEIKPISEEPAPAPVQEEPKKPAAKPVADEAKPSRQAPHTNFEDKLRTIPRHYNEGVRPRLHQNGTLPSRTFKLIAYAVMAILLILLVCIIIAGLNIEPSV